MKQAGIKTAFPRACPANPSPPESCLPAERDQPTPSACGESVRRPCPAVPARLQRCPVMSAGPQYEYLWADGVKVKTPLKLSAPDYINCLFDWVEDQVRLLGCVGYGVRLFGCVGYGVRLFWLVAVVRDRVHLFGCLGGPGAPCVLPAPCLPSGALRKRRLAAGQRHTARHTVARGKLLRVVLSSAAAVPRAPPSGSLRSRCPARCVVPARGAAGQPGHLPAAVRRLLLARLWRHGEQPRSRNEHHTSTPSQPWCQGWRVVWLATRPASAGPGGLPRALAAAVCRSGSNWRPPARLASSLFTALAPLLAGAQCPQAALPCLRPHLPLPLPVSA